MEIGMGIVVGFILIIFFLLLVILFTLLLFGNITVTALPVTLPPIAKIGDIRSS